ncbi:MAG TPA: nickel-dependent hydrogenase large subunit [bacterium]|nr:nickel-dependent hydrogenase large subunit [bacterium]
MRKKIVIDPVTRVEGHLKIEVEIEDNVVREAKSSGMLYRGIERILIGRDPRDACQITQRICGVCPQGHATASTMCLDDAFGIKEKIPENAWIVRNLMHASNHIHNSILHFYHLSILDYIDVTNVRKGISRELDLLCEFLKRDQLYPFVPRCEDFRLSQKINERIVNNYLRALEMRRIAQEAIAIFGGRMPHQCGIIPGGVTQSVDAGKIENFLGKMKDLQEFIDSYYWEDLKSIAEYYPDYWEIGSGCKNLLSFGVFPIKENGKYIKFQPPGVVSENLKYEEVDEREITESVKYSWYEGEVLNPAEDFHKVRYDKKQAYSWIKSPRYKKKVCEVGPLARVFVGYIKGKEPWRDELKKAMEEFGIDENKLFSVLGRHLCRALEAKVLVREVQKWLLRIDKDGGFYIEYKIPEIGTGIGLTEAARGALGHWIKIENYKISHYQVISPTTWNASPKDENGNNGPIEQAIIGTKVKDEENPVEILRIVRSFDPCLACAVQLIDRRRLKKKEIMVWV